MGSGGFNLGFERREGYLYARVQADFMDLEAAKEYLREIVDRVEADGYDCLLLERDIPTMLGPGSLYFAVQAFIQYIGRRRVALVNVYEPIKEPLDFAMLLAENAGGEFRLFDSVEEAENWLLSGDTVPPTTQTWGEKYLRP